MFCIPAYSLFIYENWFLRRRLWQAALSVPTFRSCWKRNSLSLRMSSLPCSLSAFSGEAKTESSERHFLIGLFYHNARFDSEAVADGDVGGHRLLLIREHRYIVVAPEYRVNLLPILIIK